MDNSSKLLMNLDFKHLLATCSLLMAIKSCNRYRTFLALQKILIHSGALPLQTIKVQLNHLDGAKKGIYSYNIKISNQKYIRGILRISLVM